MASRGKLSLGWVGSDHQGLDLCRLTWCAKMHNKNQGIIINIGTST